jgi:hypothetical protein
VGSFCKALDRARQHLAVATLELTVVAVVVCTLATFFCWFRKPLDVEVPIVQTTPASSGDILIEAGEAAAARPFRLTPLDFVDDLGPSWSIHVMARFGFRTGPRTPRPLRRLGNCRIPKLDRRTTIILFTLTHIYGSHPHDRMELFLPVADRAGCFGASPAAQSSSRLFSSGQ